MTFCVEYDNESQKEALSGLEELFCSAAAESLRYTGCPYECEADLTITDDEGIKELNRQHRDIDSVTDVLSFPLLSFNAPGDFEGIETDFADCFNPETGELMLGSVVIDMDRAKKQAEEYGHSLRREVAFLIVHSMLHLQGFDHMEDDERLSMEEAQRKILEKLDISREAVFEE